ncbi:MULTISPECIES: hypothetical protein [Mesorhizobium]|uniref:hypothetical protein n=1 Tax=Mesorhizobium TaxID=68287 RepID=UPI0010134847|nr:MULTISPECIES: hypothetical protein [Mesorhizobium]
MERRKLRELTSLSGLATEASIFHSAEMALLDRVVEQLKLENQSSDARDAIASGIIGNYMAGIVDEDELISQSKPLGR